MKLSEFRRATQEEFGETYAGVVLRDHWLPKLHMTGSEALEAGIAPKQVWMALCEEFQIAEERRYGRGLIEPEK